MIISANSIADWIISEKEKSDPLVIAPLPNLKELKKSGSASLDLRLGTWFATMRQSKIPDLIVEDEVARSLQNANFSNIQIEAIKEYLPVKATEANLIKMHYVPFGSRFILHPGNFVL